MWVTFFLNWKKLLYYYSYIFFVHKKLIVTQIIYDMIEYSNINSMKYRSFEYIFELLQFTYSYTRDINTTLYFSFVVIISIQSFQFSISHLSNILFGPFPTSPVLSFISVTSLTLSLAHSLPLPYFLSYQSPF